MPSPFVATADSSLGWRPLLKSSGPAFAGQLFGKLDATVQGPFGPTKARPFNPIPAETNVAGRAPLKSPW